MLDKLDEQKRKALARINCLRRPKTMLDESEFTDNYKDLQDFLREKVLEYYQICCEIFEDRGNWKEQKWRLFDISNELREGACQVLREDEFAPEREAFLYPSAWYVLCSLFHMRYLLTAHFFLD